MHTLDDFRQWLLEKLVLRGAHKLLRKSLGVLVYHFKFVVKLLLIVNFYRSTAHLICLHHPLSLLIVVY